METTFTETGLMPLYGTFSESAYVFTIIRTDFVRVWDKNQEANRTTRATEASLRPAKTFEDNERSDADLADNSPVLRLAGWCNQMGQAQVNLKCQFQPASVGDCILWKIDELSNATVTGAKSGNFAASDTTLLTLVPSTGQNTAHNTKDFRVKCGVDWNGNGSLESSEEFSALEFGIILVGKNEYDYCAAKYSPTKLNLLAVLFPYTAEFLDIFMDSNMWGNYDSSTADTIQFSASEAYDQRNGIGCAPTSLTQGNVDKYIWDPKSGLEEDIMLSDTFWNDVLQKVIVDLKIGDWYADPANSADNSHVFNSNGTYHGVYFGEDDLGTSLGKATFQFSIKVYTERGTTTPQIIALRVSGSVIDLYDYRTTGDDNELGWASRIQVGHAPACTRTAGEIFKVKIDYELDPLFITPSVDYNDFQELRNRWNEGINNR
ncbi:MAG: hypothetical protein R6V03_06705 [Kiritimatiellia bacterium]